MRSLGQLLKRYAHKSGIEESQAVLSDDALLRAALEALRPDLLLFVRGVHRRGNALVVAVSHPAVVQEASMLERDLLSLMEQAAGARTVKQLRFEARG